MTIKRINKDYMIVESGSLVFHLTQSNTYVWINAQEISMDVNGKIRYTTIKKWRYLRNRRSASTIIKKFIRKYMSLRNT